VKRILSIGEATLDSYIFLSDANVHCNVDKTKCEFCVNYTDKMVADDLIFSVGGNAANTAVAFSRLGFESQLFSVRGNDWIGRQIAETLVKEKIDTKYVSEVEGETSYATALIFQGERQLIVYHVPRKYRLPNFEPVDWVYLTSMGADWKHAYEKVLPLVKNNKIRMSFNPGSFQLKAGLSELRPYLKISEVLFVNRGEAVMLLDKESSVPIRNLAEELYDLGPKIVVITDAERGAYAFDGVALLHCQIFKSCIVERTGCGDSFGAGFTAALLHGEDMAEAMRWGMANSSSVIGKIGSQEGLLTREKMSEFLNDNYKTVPKKLH
jgi:sugar/nucleoside kinase (ribokinase family)